MTEAQYLNLALATLPMAAATAIALLCAATAAHRRELLLSPVSGDPAWAGALAGGLAAGVTGALVEDSGPLLFVAAVLVLGCVACYLHGRPPQVQADAESVRTAVRAGAVEHDLVL